MTNEESMASNELREVVKTMREQDGIAAAGLSLEERRAAMTMMQGNLPMPDDISMQEVDIDGVPGRWISVTGVRDDAVILYFHGGGYVMGSLDTHQELMGRLSRSCDARVLGVDYRLAPEAPYPAAVEDAVKSYRWLLDQGVPSDRVMLAGDSAGGGLAFAAMLFLRDAGDPLPAGAITFSPWADLTSSGESMLTRADADPMVTRDVVDELSAHYHADVDPAEPLISPVFADLTGLPPLLIQVGDAEVLLDDAARLADNARKVSCSVEYHVFDEAFHVFQSVPIIPEAAEALAEAGEFFKAHVG
jgi:monoterpene epsilon-lactone hydrolase